MHRKIAAALLTACIWILLSGCADMALTAQPAPTLIPGEPQRTQAAQPMRAFTKTVGMYYPRTDMSDLERKPVEIVCEEGLWLPEVLVHGLLEPVGDPRLISLFRGTAQLNSISSCSGMLIVDLDYDRTITDRELFASVLAMSRTLSLEAGADYVLFLSRGSRIPMKGLIANPMSADSSISTDTWRLQRFYLENGYFGEEFAGEYTPQEEMQLLFYADESGNHILCEKTQLPTRRMTQKLADSLFHLAPTDAQLSLTERYALTVENLEGPQDGYVQIEVKSEASDTKDLEMLRELITLNLRLNDERIQGVTVIHNGEDLSALLTGNPGPYGAQQAKERFGETMTLYFLHPDTGSLVETGRVVSFAQSISPTAWMQALIEGPGPYDDPDLMGTFPEGIQASDLIRVETDGMNAVVDLSARFAELYPSQDPFMERMMIYSAVNTLTQDDWIQRVLFRVEGQQLDHLGGELYLGTPLMGNPGLISDRTQEQGEGS